MMKKLLALLWLALSLGGAQAQSISQPGSSGGLTAGTTTVTGCTALNLFYDNSGVMGCMGGTSWDDTNKTLTIANDGKSAFILSAGALATPAISLGGTNTGLLSVSANTVSLSAGGAEYLRVGTSLVNIFQSTTFLNRITVGSASAVTGAAGEIGVAKITDSGTAPGAAYVKLTVVCGTNAGSAKIIARGGTSTTAVTVLDNIGSGVTGC